jgi:hypothetical protein
MSATQFQAMLRAGGVSGTGERKLKKHLSAHLGKGFCPTRRSVNMLSEGHCKVYYGSIEFTYDGKEKAEFIEWTENREEYQRGAFSLARIINPTDEDAEAYQTFILAAVSGSKILQCSITPKIHAMLMHVQWQMKNIPGG